MTITTTLTGIMITAVGFPFKTFLPRHMPNMILAVTLFRGLHLQGDRLARRGQCDQAGPRLRHSKGIDSVRINRQVDLPGILRSVC